MNLIKLTATAAIVSSILCSCGTRNDNKPSDESATVDNTRTEITKSYMRGREEARAIIESCATESEVREMLLQTNARLHLISSKGSQDMADDFLRGLRDELKDSGDTLASTLFPD